MRIRLVRCSACQRRNATDAWRLLRGARARCGACGAPLPRRLPAWTLALAAVVLLVVLAFGAGGWRVLREARYAGLEGRVEALAASARFEEASRLLFEDPEGGRHGARKALAERLSAHLSEVAFDPSSSPADVDRAFGVGDELLEARSEAWPELVGEVEPALEALRVRRAVERLAQDLAEAESGAAPPDLAGAETALRAAAERTRGLEARAAGELAPFLALAWDLWALSVARRRVATDPRAAREALRLHLDLPSPAPAAARPGSGDDGEPSPPTSATEALADLRAAVDARDLIALRTLVRWRALEGWSAPDRQAFDASLGVACRAFSSLAAAQARLEPTAEQRARLLLDALTCDELSPAAFRGRVLAALAEAQLRAAEEEGAPLPSAREIGSRFEPRRRDEALERLACLARERARPDVAVAALLLVESDAALQRGLRCEGRPSRSPELEREAAWPMLDYPSASEGGSGP